MTRFDPNWLYSDWFGSDCKLKIGKIQSKPFKIDWIRSKNATDPFQSDPWLPLPTMPF